MSVDGLMHALHRYVAARLADRLRKTRVVVFYDRRREFTPFFEQAETAGEGTGGLPQVALDGTMSHLARFKGSFFQLRYDIEPILAQPSPERLVVYIAGVERDRQNSLLMEAELGGDTYEPQFKKIAHEVLRKQLTEGQVDELLRGEVTYDDVAGFLDSGGGGASVLRTILGHESGERLLAGWLLKPSVDGDIESKGGTNELFSLLTERVGLKLTADRDLARARRSTLRYLLVNEFRMDYEGEPPAELDSVAAVPRSECKARIQKVVKELRERHADAYADGARQVQSDLQFEYSALDPTRLGRVDTFPIEEEVLLGHVAELLAEGKHAPAKKLIEERRESFWAARDMRRQSQWEVCQRIAALNSALDEARRVLARPMRDAEAWVEAYAAHDGLHRVDCLHRSLEAFCATLDDEPVAEAALAKVRFRYVDILRRMADAFTTALEASGWSVGGYQRQADTFAHLDQRSGDPVAYFLVDAFRYEMGVELADILTDVEELSVEPAIAALPTITPVGMAALMPGASSDFSVLDAGGKLASRIGATALKDWADRWRRWQALVPGVKELDLERVLRETTGQLTRAVEGAPLVLVRSQEIDLAGESDGGSVAHHVIASIVSSLARAVRKLAKAGITRFVITSDHGHLFARLQGRRHEDGSSGREHPPPSSAVLGRAGRDRPRRDRAPFSSGPRLRLGPGLRLSSWHGGLQGRWRSPLPPRRPESPGVSGPGTPGSDARRGRASPGDPGRATRCSGSDHHPCRRCDARSRGGPLHGAGLAPGRVDGRRRGGGPGRNGNRWRDRPWRSDSSCAELGS